MAGSDSEVSALESTKNRVESNCWNVSFQEQLVECVETDAKKIFHMDSITVRRTLEYVSQPTRARWYAHTFTSNSIWCEQDRRREQKKKKKSSLLNAFEVQENNKAQQGKHSKNYFSHQDLLLCFGQCALLFLFASHVEK